MSYEGAGTGRRRSPLGPLVGLIVLLGVGAGAYLAAPALMTWLETTQFEIAALGWQILPVTFPEAWSEVVTRVVITGLASLLGFTILMLVLFSFMRPRRDEHDISLGSVRAQKKKQKRR